MNKNGMTLIEIIIAVAITAMIFGIAIGFFSSFKDNANKNDSDKNQEYRVLENRFRNDLNNIMYSIYKEKNRLEYNYTMLEFDSKEENKIYEISYEYNPSNRTLVRTKKIKNSEEKEETLEFFKDEKIVRVEFHFYSKLYRYWKNEWSYKKEERFPELVKMDIWDESGKNTSISAEIFAGREF